MRYLKLDHLLFAYKKVMKQSGGSSGLRDKGALESCLAQPKATFDGVELYPTLEDKASVLIFSIVKNHPFIDGNKRAGQIAMEKFLELNGFEIDSTVNEQEQVILKLTSGVMSREELTEWLKSHIVEKGK